MAIDNWMIYTAIEVILVLLVLCGLLLFHAKGLKAAIQALQNRLSQALSELKAAKLAQNSQPADIDESLQAQIADTEAFHAQQNPDRSIEADLAPDSPPARLAAALRHRFLKTEQAAHRQGVHDWDQLVQAYQPMLDSKKAPSQEPLQDNPTPDPGALSYEEQRHEIARFKRLFTTMEGQWKEAKNKAEGYYQELIRLIGSTEDPAQQALKALAESELAQLSQQQVPVPARSADGPNRDDLDHLKSENAAQREQIEQLKARLADLPEGDQTGLIGDLERQLEKQLRLMQESEVCIELLEQEIAGLNKKLAESKSDLPDSPNIDKLFKEKQQLSKKIQQLEGENEQLVGLAEAADAEQRRRLAEKDAEIGKLKKKLVQMIKANKSEN
ncbi:hypothetical protein [Simiduia agarivorans]|uniref:Uncharacterized protein n=1 Tax=Simiduia agarivorans (strain DSM 21679 / JCM 13881 / BCRC 17597 / SA1) TaxID=1117647 RepID=K4KVQ3_SIMAS|nr:hypothetical protein [Simiduia agarivorans]AFU98022.1 hypothetical protein M5M_04075 [Simiduia agarivorans SA1 = DSM 21679]